jgi:chitin disaccharide deacetylase
VVRSRQRHLIVTADDFGLNETVNDAVERTSRGGILTAAGLRVSGPAAADAVRRARRLPNLRVGLHLVLADGWSYFARAAACKPLEAEIRSQFAAFSRTGLALDHVSAQRNLQLHPNVLDILNRIARESGARAVRVPNEPLWFAGRQRGWLAAAAAALLTPWLVLVRHRLRAAGIFHNDCSFGIAQGGSMDEAQLLAILARLPPGVTEIYYVRAEQLAGLLSPRVREAIAALNIRRGGYSDILMNIGRSLA